MFPNQTCTAKTLNLFTLKYYLLTAEISDMMNSLRGSRLIIYVKYSTIVNPSWDVHRRIRDELANASEESRSSWASVTRSMTFRARINCKLLGTQKPRNSLIRQLEIRVAYPRTGLNTASNRRRVPHKSLL